MIGFKINLERRRLGLTLQKLADITNSSKSYICELEHGRTKEVGASKLLLLSAALKVSMEYLADDSIKPESIFKYKQRIRIVEEPNGRETLEYFDNDIDSWVPVEKVSRSYVNRNG